MKKHSITLTSAQYATLLSALDTADVALDEEIGCLVIDCERYRETVQLHAAVTALRTAIFAKIDEVAEWSGSLCPIAPDTCWVDDATGEHVNAVTNARTPRHCR